MTYKQAQKELKRLQGLNDGKDYCMAMSFGGKWRVSEKTAEQKNIDNFDRKTADMKVTDFVKNHNILDDLH